MKNKDSQNFRDDLEVIRENFGDDMSEFCGVNFANILKKRGALSSILLDSFYPTKSLLDDIKNSEMTENFIKTIFKEYAERNHSLVDSLKKFKYFFTTSIAKGSKTLSGRVLAELEPSIKSFFKYINSLNEEINLELTNYIKAKDGKFYRFSCHSSVYGRDIYCCADNIKIENLKKEVLDKSRYILMDNFILDLQDKKVEEVADRYFEKFIDSLGHIKNIEVVETPFGRDVKFDSDFEYIREPSPVIIRLDKENNIVGYINNNILELGDCFLSKSTKLETIEAGRVRKIGECCLSGNLSMKRIFLPNVREIGSCFLEKNTNLEEICLPKLKKLGFNSFLFGGKFEVVDLPELEEMSSDCFAFAKDVKQINLPKVKRIGRDVFGSNRNFSLGNLPYMPNLEFVQEGLFGIREDPCMIVDACKVSENDNEKVYYKKNDDLS